MQLVARKGTDTVNRNGDLAGAEGDVQFTPFNVFHMLAKYADRSYPI